jgi:hypothetical protein
MFLFSDIIYQNFSLKNSGKIISLRPLGLSVEITSLVKAACYGRRPKGFRRKLYDPVCLQNKWLGPARLSYTKQLSCHKEQKCQDAFWARLCKICCPFLVYFINY